jgi:hypothetical protein
MRFVAGRKNISLSFRRIARGRRLSPQSLIAADWGIVRASLR